jgi:hypothetical protein
VIPLNRLIVMSLPRDFPLPDVLAWSRSFMLSVNWAAV